MTEAADLSLTRFGHPRYWGTWLLLGTLHVVAWLPFRWQTALGRGLGRLYRRVRRRDERVARRNLEICFPELDDAARDALLAKHFESVGLSVVEMAIGWFSSLAKLRRLVTVAGREHLDAALAEGRGALVVSAHFTPVEVGVAILEDFCPNVSCMYRTQRNAMMDVVIRRGRSRFAHAQIPRDDVRGLLKRLRAGDVVLYMPDQTYLGNQSALLPFFGEPALTNTATSRLAEISGAPVLTYFFRRREDDSGYLVEIGPALEGFPTSDRAADTLRIVDLLERYIRGAPDQYLWLYKKFKRRPPELPNAYP